MEICFQCLPEHTEGEEQREQEKENKWGSGQGKMGVYKRLQKKRQATEKWQNSCDWIKLQWQ